MVNFSVLYMNVSPHGIVHFKTNYNYRLSNHCFINELILVTYALISNTVEKWMVDCIDEGVTGY